MTLLDVSFSVSAEKLFASVDKNFTSIYKQITFPTVL